MAFTHKLIDLTLTLANGVFGAGGPGNSAKLTGLRVSCKINKAGGDQMGTLHAAVYGLPLSLMNQLTTLGTQLNFADKNMIVVEAGDAETGMAMVYQGTISCAWADMQAMPQVCLRIQAHAGHYEALATSKPTSYSGGAGIKQIMSDLAKKMNLPFEDNLKDDVMLTNPNFPGSYRTQAQTAARAAGVEWIIDSGKLAIWKPGTTRQGDTTLISPQTGLVGYPGFNQAGIVFRTIFNKNLQPGGKVTVKSDLTPACGDWFIYSLDYDLESQVPQGAWFCEIAAGPIRGVGPA